MIIKVIRSDNNECRFFARVFERKRGAYINGCAYFQIDSAGGGSVRYKPEMVDTYATLYQHSGKVDRLWNGYTARPMEINEYLFLGRCVRTNYHPGTMYNKKTDALTTTT